MTADTVIRVEGLSKKYVLGSGSTTTPGDGLRHAIQRAITAPFRGRQRLAPGKEFYALRDVSFDVKCGEVLGIIGNNGAGKSTLLKILSRITEPSQGRVGIKGRVASLLEVGTGFHPELTGRENIFLNGSILGMSRAEVKRKLDEIIDFSGVEKFIDTPVKRYSSGMYVRLAFAVAAHLEPEILIVDEVLAVGDAEFQKKCLGKMKGIAGQGRTILFVSHNLHAVQALCRNALLLRNGAVIDRGPAQEVGKRYLAEHSAPTGGTVHTESPLFALKHTSVSYVEREDEAEISIELDAVSPGPLDGLTVDVAIENEEETRILQFMPKVYHHALVTKAASVVRLSYGSFLPHLRPGSYTLTVYAHLQYGTVVSHVAGIPAFTVVASARRPETFQSGFTAVTMPKFSMDVECHETASRKLSHAL